MAGAGCVVSGRGRRKGLFMMVMLVMTVVKVVVVVVKVWW